MYAKSIWLTMTSHVLPKQFQKRQCVLHALKKELKRCQRREGLLLTRCKEMMCIYNHARYGRSWFIVAHVEVSLYLEIINLGNNCMYVMYV